MAKYKYGKHCHLCACFTKDPIVRSYFHFLKYLTSLLQSFSILSSIAINFLCLYVIVCSCSEQLQKCEWEICRACRGKKVFHQFSLIGHLWWMIWEWSLVLQDPAKCSLPSQAVSCCSRFPFLFPSVVNEVEAATFSFLCCRILQYN